MSQGDWSSNDFGQNRAIPVHHPSTLSRLCLGKAEAAGLGVVGAAIGAVFGMANQYVFASALTNVLSIDVAFAASLQTLVFACAAFALTLLGAIPPAVRAARLNFVDALVVD